MRTARLRCQGAGRNQVVLDSVLKLDDLGLADVHADDRAYGAAVFGFEVCAGGGNARASRCGTVIVEAHAVDNRLIFHEAEEARLRVAGLRLTGDSTDLDVAEADTSQRGNTLTALVEASSQTERRGESNTHDGGCQFRCRLEVLAQRTGDADVAQGLNAPEADVVCLLGVHALEEDVEEGRVDAHLFSLRLEGVGGLWGYEPGMPGLYAWGLLVVGDGVDCATVAAVAARVLFDGFPEGAAVDVGPEHVHEDELGVGALPEQEV